MPKIYDMGPTALLPLRRKACWGFFRPKKIRLLRPGLNPRTWVLKASTLPLDHRSHHVNITHKQNQFCKLTFIRTMHKDFPHLLAKRIRIYHKSQTVNLLNTCTNTHTHTHTNTHTHTHCEQNAEFLRASAGVPYVYHWDWYGTVNNEEI